MKQIKYSFSFVLLLLIFTGCSSMYRVPIKKTVVLSKKEIDVKMLKTTSYTNQWLVPHEGGAKVEITNLTDKVKYINWAASSITYNGTTSRINIGSDRLKNFNTITPNTVIMPHAKITVNLIAADSIELQVYTAVTYVKVDPPMETAKEIDLIISYSDSNVNKLKQSVFSYFF